MKAVICTSYDWQQCEKPTCRLWRRIAWNEVSKGGKWNCGMISNPKFASCDVAQEFDDDEIERQKVDHVCVHNCTRSSLDRCTTKTFFQDLCAFLKHRGNEALVQKLRQGRVKLNNKPLDFLKLYKLVCQRGGVVDYDSGPSCSRMNMKVGWSTDILEIMNNKQLKKPQPSAGSQLMNVYLKYLHEYEVAHPQDVPGAKGPVGLYRNSGGNGRPIPLHPDTDIGEQNISSRSPSTLPPQTKARKSSGTNNSPAAKPALESKEKEPFEFEAHDANDNDDTPNATDIDSPEGRGKKMSKDPVPGSAKQRNNASKQKTKTRSLSASGGIDKRRPTKRGDISGDVFANEDMKGRKTQFTRRDSSSQYKEVENADKVAKNKSGPSSGSKRKSADACLEKSPVSAKKVAKEKVDPLDHWSEWPSPTLSPTKLSIEMDVALTDFDKTFQFTRKSRKAASSVATVPKIATSTDDKAAAVTPEDPPVYPSWIHDRHNQEEKEEEEEETEPTKPELPPTDGAEQCKQQLLLTSGSNSIKNQDLAETYQSGGSLCNDGIGPAKEQWKESTETDDEKASPLPDEDDDDVVEITSFTPNTKVKSRNQLKQSHQSSKTHSPAKAKKFLNHSVPQHGSTNANNTHHEVGRSAIDTTAATTSVSMNNSTPPVRTYKGGMVPLFPMKGNRYIPMSLSDLPRSESRPKTPKRKKKSDPVLGGKPEVASTGGSNKPPAKSRQLSTNTAETRLTGKSSGVSSSGPPPLFTTHMLSSNHQHSTPSHSRPSTAGTRPTTTATRPTSSSGRRANNQTRAKRNGTTTNGVKTMRSGNSRAGPSNSAKKSSDPIWLNEPSHQLSGQEHRPMGNSSFAVADANTSARESERSRVGSSQEWFQSQAGVDSPTGYPKKQYKSLLHALRAQQERVSNPPQTFLGPPPNSMTLQSEDPTTPTLPHPMLDPQYQSIYGNVQTGYNNHGGLVPEALWDTSRLNSILRSYQSQSSSVDTPCEDLRSIDARIGNGLVNNFIDGEAQYRSDGLREGLQLLSTAAQPTRFLGQSWNAEAREFNANHDTGFGLQEALARSTKSAPIPNLLGTFPENTAYQTDLPPSFLAAGSSNSWQQVGMATSPGKPACLADLISKAKDRNPPAHFTQ